MAVETTLRMVEFAEEELRYLQAPDPVLRVERSGRRGLGKSMIYSHGLWADSRGLRDDDIGQRATWTQILRVLRALRAEQPVVARTRDLAEAYHYLRWYSRAYGTPRANGVPCDALAGLLNGLRDTVRRLGGDLAAFDAATARRSA